MIIEKNQVRITNKRNSSIEVLRFIFMYLIVVLHVFIHGYDQNYDTVFSLGSNLLTCFHFGMVMLGKIGVIGFVFISGYYGIKLSPRKVGCMLAIVSFYYVILQFAAHRPLTELPYYIFRPFGIWWFVRYYLALMLLAPIINQGWACLNKQNQNFILFLLLYIFCVDMFLRQQDSHDLMFMIVIYVFGRFIRDREFKIILLYLLSMLAILVYLIVPVIIVNMSDAYHKYLYTWFSHNNFLLLIASAGAVVWADNHKFTNRYVNWAASSVLSIYLITDYGHLRSFDKQMLPYMLNWWGYLMCLMVCVGCVAFDKIRGVFFSTIEKARTFFPYNELE